MFSKKRFATPYYECSYCDCTSLERFCEIIHTLMDQMTYDDQESGFKTDHLTLRVMIVNSLKTVPSNKRRWKQGNLVSKNEAKWCFL